MGGRPVLCFVVGAISLMGSNVASAGDGPPDVVQDAGSAVQQSQTEAASKPDEGGREQGWVPGLAIGASFNLLDSRAVVGQQDGTTVTLGGAVDGSLELNAGIHEWRNTLSASAATARTPLTEEFVKTGDGLSVETIYLVHVIEVFGPFARLAMDTQMFAASDVRATAVDYVVSNLDGTTSEFTGRRLALTEPFQPLTLKESLGVFVQPVRRLELELEARGGLGAQETFAEGGLAITDDEATAALEVSEVDDNFQVGAELVINAWGFVDEAKRISYSAGFGVLFPFVTSALPDGDERNLGQLTSVEAKLGLNVKLFDWASLGYRLEAARMPLLVDDWQVSNNLLLTLSAAFGSKAPAPPKPSSPPSSAEAEGGGAP